MKEEISSWVEDVKATAKQEEREAVVKFLKEFDPILALAIMKEEHLK